MGTSETSSRAPRRALVSGASSGIGAATVRALCARGYEVVAIARREDRVDAVRHGAAGTAGEWTGAQRYQRG